MRKVVAACGLALIPLMLTVPALGSTYVVNPDGTGDFPTIQAAVDSSADGDIIELGNGVFRGNGNRDVTYLGKAITIRSQGGPEACVIDCEGSTAEPHRGFLFGWFDGPGGALEGVTVTNGYATFGGAVRCSITPSPPTILRCAFVHNGPGQSQGAGGAVYSYGAGVSVTDCVFFDNAAATGGAVSICDPVPPAIFTRCTFATNRALDGGAIDI
jgi:hypothetical protein